MKKHSSKEIPEKAVLFASEGIIRKANAFFMGLTGYSGDNLIHKSVYEVFEILLKATADIRALKPGDGSVTCFLFTKALEPIEIVLSIECDNGEEMYIFYEKPDSRLYGKIHDNDRLFSDNKMGICIWSVPDLVLLKANELFLSILDEPDNLSEKAIGRRLQEIVTGNIGTDFKKVLEDLIHTKQSYYAGKPSNLIYKKNKYFHNSMVIPIMEDDEVKYLLAVFTEVTEYVREKARSQEQKRIIEQQKEQLETIIENMSDGLLITDKNQSVILMNAAARAVYPDPELSNNLENWFDMVRVTDQYGNPIPIEDMPSHRAARGERVKNFRVNISGPLRAVNIEYCSAPLYDSRGNISMIINCSRDVTEHVRNSDLINQNQEKLLNAEVEKNEALQKAIALKDEFLSLISHEFKTPITVIISAVQAMEYLCWEQFSDKARGFIGRIKQNAFRQLRLVNNLLEITKIGSGQIKLKTGNFDIVYLASSITDSVQEYASQKHINLFFESTVNSILIGIDDEKFERILLNLLSNAIKFTPKEKSVIVRVSETAVDQRKMVCVEVQDEGIGIPEDKQAVIFEKFVQVDSSLTRQAEGTGLGLPLVKMLVEAMGGVIKLESQMGKGSIFTVLLPSEKAEDSPADTQSAQTSDSRLIQAVKVEFSDLY